MKYSKSWKAKKQKHEDNELDLAAIMMGGWLLGESGRSAPHVDDDSLFANSENFIDGDDFVDGGYDDDIF